ncbi:MAG: glutamate dehydrogenase [Trebouxia sp. A1-2]|nr:MAG: glutamate dehydrogenase [Trebouxia sp. A1-2]
MAPPKEEAYDRIVARDPDQKEFLQAVEEVFTSLAPVIEKKPEYAAVLERIAEPERQIAFRVPWFDDKGTLHINRGYRIQTNSALGPYKGGLRLAPSVTLSIIKFLGFEQVFKNSLTTLPMGGGKGGSDFNPKGRSISEITRFCQSFMTELHKYIGPNEDVPAGDMGCSPREIGWMYGQWKRLTSNAGGVLTGKGLTYGGSLIRPESTGYGTVYFTQEILKDQDTDLKGKRVAISGSGNVAIYAAYKCLEFGAKVITLSDSGGYHIVEDGMTKEMIDAIDDIKVTKKGRLHEYKNDKGKYVEGKKPWSADTKYDIALPCATQNEIGKDDAEALVKSGVKLVAEGANMPTESAAIAVFHKNNVVYAPGKAANAGGVAVSGLEMSQNAMRLQWTSEEVDNKLKDIMKGIYKACKDAAKEYDTTLQAGANIAGFLKVAEAMVAQAM